MIQVHVLSNSAPSHHRWVRFVSVNQIQVMFHSLFQGGINQNQDGAEFDATNLTPTQVPDLQTYLWLRSGRCCAIFNLNPMLQLRVVLLPPSKH